MATLSNRKTGYVLREKGVSTRYLPKTDYTKAQAKALQSEATAREQKRRQGFSDNVTEFRKGTMTFRKFADEHLESYGERYPRSLEKRSGALKKLMPFFGDLHLSDRQELWVNAWHALRAEHQKLGLTGNTTHTYWAELNATLKDAVKSKRCHARPFGELTWNDPKIGVEVNPPKFYFFSREELAQLYRCSGDYWGALWKLMVNTGVRRGEIMQLPIDNVHDDYILIEHNPRKGLRTKTGRSREIPLSKDAQEAVQTLLEHGTGTGLLIPEIHRTDLSKRFTSDRKAAGIKDGWLHCLRHTFISHMVNEVKESLPIVQELSGHSTLSAVQVYLHSTRDQKVEAIRKLAL